jgi:hypothetical protein
VVERQFNNERKQAEKRAKAPERHAAILLHTKQGLATLRTKDSF